MDILQIADQFRRAVQMFAANLDAEKALEIATIYEPWSPDKKYTVGEYFTYGENSVGDPQLYRVVSEHTSQSDWTPGAVESLYEPIGLDDEGYPVWSQPSGAHDAYNVGDVVNYNGVLYESVIDGNCTIPGSDPRYWTEYTERSDN